MRRLGLLLILGSIILFPPQGPAGTQAAPDAAPSAPQARPQFWMGPPGHDDGRGFRELFEKPDQWKETRSVVDVLMYADHNLKRHFSDDQLRPWFAQLKQWGLKFAMEVGAVKPWGPTGEKCFTVERPNWEHLQSLGANFYAVAMDEPLACTRLSLHQPDDYGVRETAAYIALVRKNFPQVLVGDIEAYPFAPLADHYRWIDALQKRLAEMNVRGLDFYRLDVDWVHFVHGHGSWADVKQLEQYCRRRKLPFSLIYWAADYPALGRMGLVGEATWYVSLIQQGYDYALVHGLPDQYVVQSWVPGPPRITPESNPWSFTRSALDFNRIFVQHKPPGASGQAAR
jgi:hypothetical protein